MNRKTSLSAADLFVLLDREFRRRKARECASCSLQLPYRLPGSHGANWQVVAPSACARGCDAVLEELVREFQALYELEPETAPS
jgi:hypothetical protein